MTDVIICTALHEPPGFFDGGKTVLSTAATLSYDCRAPHAMPKNRFQDFLNALPSATFKVYRFVDPYLQIATDWEASTDNTPSKDTAAANILAWLERRGQSPNGDAPSDDYWMSAARAGETLTLADLKAAQYLATSAAWPASLPQDAGLIRIVHLTATVDGASTDKLLLVPFFDGAKPDQDNIPATLDADGVISFKYDAGTDFADAWGEIRYLIESISDPTSLIDDKIGFLFARPGIDDVHTILKGIEEKSASLFWTFPVLVSIDWPVVPDDDRVTPVKRLVWRTMNSLVALLDPAVLSLTMAGQKEAQGPFLSALAAAVEDNAPEAKTSGLAAFVLDELKKLLGPSNVIENDRKALTKLLGNLLGFEDPAKASAEVSSPVPLVLRIYGEDQWPDDLDDEGIGTYIESLTTRFGSLEAAVSNDLQQLAQRLQAEEGFENLILALVERTNLTVVPPEIGKKGPLEDLCGISKEKAGEAIADFKKQMQDVFNGLDAARHAQSQLFEHFLVAATVDKSKTAGTPWTAADLDKNLEDAEWFIRRMRIPELVDGKIPAQAFDGIVDVLATYAQIALSDTDKGFLRNLDATKPSAGRLTSDFVSACTEIVDPSQGRRFVPDVKPKPLPLQLAVDINTADLDNFADIHSGAGVLVRREGGEWAYANLAELAQRKPMPDDKGEYYDFSGITVLPLQPVAIDGQRRLFLEYDGLPFTSDAFVDTRTPPIAAEDPGVPFFIHQDPPGKNLGKKKALPALAYGTTFETAAFVISKGGSLPKSLQYNAKIPWLPIDKPPADLAKEYVGTHDCRRTTSIGRMTIVETPDPGSRPRIGAAIEGVQPLALDYPRVGITAEAGKRSVFDLLRNGDGTGAISLPGDKAKNQIGLSDLWWWGGKGDLVVALFSYPAAAPDDTPDLQWQFTIDSPFVNATVTLEITGDGSADEPETRVLTCRLSSEGRKPAPGESQEIKKGAGSPPLVLSRQSAWLRISIKSTAEAAALSLADPNASGDRGTGLPAVESLLVIAPPSDEWRIPYKQVVKGKIIFPRIGFLDFDRWLNNLDLAALAKKSADGGAKDDARFDSFRNLAMTGYVGRHVQESLSPLIDNMPDLSVDQILVELSPLDGLDKAPSDLVTSKLPKVISHVMPMETLGARLKQLALPDGYTKTAINLTAIGETYTATIEVSATEGGDLSVTPTVSKYQFKLQVSVPRGRTARLTIRPMVAARHLRGDKAVFDPGIATLASEIRDNYYIFDGASLTIEAMLGEIASQMPANPWQASLDTKQRRSLEWENLVTAATTVRPATFQRSYDLITQSSKALAAKNGWWWRQLASIDIVTQRWRFTGRPIYSWLDPKGGNASFAAAIPQKSVDKVLAFESEIFFDRDDRDADSQSMRLNPEPDATILQSFPWEQPSATYFRHRLRIHGRYEGALQSDRTGAIRAWGADGSESVPPTSDARSWIRVAMLADRTRLQLARPQLRALMPLTLAPDSGDAPASAPPVLGILDEKPFAHGGLADRIAGEIRTGFGYELPEDPNYTLYVKDSRKEIGADPRLTYSPFPEDDAFAVALLSEGPIGLTFDSAGVRAPVFANTALILHPTVLTGEDVSLAALEEHFLSVGLRRYLDPSWLVDDPLDEDDCAKVSKTWWIELPNYKDWSFQIKGEAKPIITGKLADGRWTVELNSGVTDPAGKPPANPWIKLCKIAESRTKGLALLHLPLEKGRASLSVFALPLPSEVRVGSSNMPIMLTSFEWQVPKTADQFEFEGRSFGTSASPTTLLNWTRTGKNFDLWHASVDGTLVALNTSDIVARPANDKYVFGRRLDSQKLSFEPLSSRYANPLYVHRHHAVVATGRVKGIGRPVEAFRSAARIFGDPFVLKASDDVEKVRLIEFETPAQPLAWLASVAKSDALKALQKAHFDLYSLVGSSQAHKPPTGVSLFIRPLGGEGTTSKLTQVMFKITLLPQTESSNVTVNIVAGKALRGILLGMNNKDGSLSISAQSIFSGGDVSEVTSLDHELPYFELKKTTAIELEIASVTPHDMPEFWTDISLLTLKRGDTGPGREFDFDWFFSGGDYASPAEAITEAALGDMREAQARIIAVSPPIEVKS